MMWKGRVVLELRKKAATKQHSQLPNKSHSVKTKLFSLQIIDLSSTPYSKQIGFASTPPLE